MPDRLSALGGIIFIGIALWVWRGGLSDDPQTKDMGKIFLTAVIATFGIACLFSSPQ